MNPLDIPSCPDEGILFWIHQTSPYPHTLTMDKGVYDNTVQCTLSLDPRMLFRILIINSHMKKKKTIYPIWLPARHRDVESFVTKHQLTRRGWINHWLICLTFTTATYQGQVHPPTHTLHKRAKWAGLTGRLLPYITCLQQYMFLLIKTELCLGGVCAAKEKKLRCEFVNLSLEIMDSCKGWGTENDCVTNVNSWIMVCSGGLSMWWLMLVR